MQVFRLFLIVVLLVNIGYTAVTISNHGIHLLPVFFGDIARMDWPGQFNMDFSSFLLLSGLWTAWRNGFSASGLALAVVAALGGILFLATYLLVLSYTCGGDIRVMMLGKQAAHVSP
ncbi:hypothetical protein [Blastomonas sp.]|uniref:hypothetical protein n=1 Tax=Blastomonas sp. TaxID=1909299 RepID=UPI00359312FD